MRSRVVRRPLARPRPAQVNLPVVHLPINLCPQVLISSDPDEHSPGPSLTAAGAPDGVPWTHRAIPPSWVGPHGGGA